MWFDYAYDQGLSEGYRLGKTDGRHSAKGSKNKARKRGRPPLMNGSYIVLMIEDVKDREKGMTIEQGVDHFLKGMKAAPKYLGEECELPSKKEAMGMYFSARRKDPSQLSPLSGSRDDGLRFHISQLLKKAAQDF
jgi:hypothetical protein